MATMLVTGSSRGIGAEVARLAAADGWTVVLHGRSPSDRLLALAAELSAPWIACRAEDRALVHAAVAAEPALVAVDALVNCLGTVRPTDVVRDGDEVWLDQFATNVLGPLHFCQAVVPGMRERGGSVVLVSSIRGLATMAVAEVAAYSVAKAALVNLTAALAREFAPAVRVNCVAPGFTLTDMAGSWSAAVRASVATALLGRAAEPREIAEVITFLASPRSSFVTGQTILADGGFELALS